MEMEIFKNLQGNADGMMSERKMEGEDSVVRTVDCLRGRLLAERAASRDAKAEAEQLQTKLMELENLLKQEAKSRNRAEKKLKFLMKKLESMNISHLSDESEYSGLIDKTDISSISSTASAIIKQREINENQQTKFSGVFQTRESKEDSSFDDSSTAEGTSVSSAFESNPSEFKGTECEMVCDKDAISPRISRQNSAQNEDSLSCASDQQQSEKSSSNMDEQSDLWDHSNRCGGGDSDCEGEVDDSMALVVVDTPQTSHGVVDPEVLDATVKEVLDTLRVAKEKLQSSMVRRRMKMGRVGETNPSVKSSAIFI